MFKLTVEKCILFLVMGLITHCTKDKVNGTLLVTAHGSGSYEIFKISSESPLQFISEESGQFNQTKALSPGSYLILADCSSANIIVYPNETTKLNTHTVQFNPPLKTENDGNFSIQCDRSDKTRSRQHITNRFTLNILEGRRDLLVNMVPLRLDLTDSTPDSKKTRNILKSFNLAAIQVASFPSASFRTSFFITPVDQLISATKAQHLGHWLFILPGEYHIELNGTSTTVTLAEGDKKIIQPGFLSVSTPPETDLDQTMKVTGNPQLVEINNGHSLRFNEVYPVLPGEVKVQVTGSNRVMSHTVVEKETLEIKTNVIVVDLGCEKDDWLCLGKKDISLFLPDQAYPFMESVTDIPIIYIASEHPIWIGIGGSRDIKYKLPNTIKRHQVLRVGYLEIVPKPQLRAGQVTDLLRVEATGHPFTGHTLDINLEHPTLVPLIAGTYRLAHFVSLHGGEYERRKSNSSWTVTPGKTQTVELPIYYSEKRFAAYQERQAAKSTPSETTNSKNSAPSSEKAL